MSGMDYARIGLAGFVLGGDYLLAGLFLWALATGRPSDALFGFSFIFVTLVVLPFAIWGVAPVAKRRYADED